MADKHCRRADDPPSRGPKSDILRVKADQTKHFLALADRHEGYDQHWILKGKGYSDECTDPKSECRHCLKQYPLRWRAYLWVAELPQARNFGHLELTEGALNQFKLYLGDKTWVGARIEVRRGKGATSALTVIHHEWLPYDRMKGMPLNRPVLPVLEELWAKARLKNG